MLLGYARVSTDDQDLALQRAALKEADCRKIFEEKVSGANRARAELDRLLEHLREGDVIVVSRLDRLARSTRDLLTLAEEIAERGAGLRSIPTRFGVPGATNTAIPRRWWCRSRSSTGRFVQSSSAMPNFFRK